MNHPRVLAQILSRVPTAALSTAAASTTRFPTSIHTLTRDIQNSEYLSHFFWPIAKHSELQHDAFSCLSYPGSQPVPSIRQGTEFIGATYDGHKPQQHEVEELVAAIRPEACTPAEEYVEWHTESGTAAEPKHDTQPQIQVTISTSSAGHRCPLCVAERQQRCGETFHNKVCSSADFPYCSRAAWCGNTDAHKSGSRKYWYDQLPAGCCGKEGADPEKPVPKQITAKPVSGHHTATKARKTSKPTTKPTTAVPTVPWVRPVVPEKVPIYFINLDKNSERTESMHKQLSDLNLPATRIAGVLGTKKMCPACMDKLSLSEIGCTASHLKAINASYENGDEMAVFTEV